MQLIFGFPVRIIQTVHDDVFREYKLLPYSHTHIEEVTISFLFRRIDFRVGDHIVPLRGSGVRDALPARTAAPGTSSTSAPTACHSFAGISAAVPLPAPTAHSSLASAAFAADSSPASATSTAHHPSTLTAGEVRRARSCSLGELRPPNARAIGQALRSVRTSADRQALHIGHTRSDRQAIQRQPSEICGPATRPLQSARS